MHAGFWRRPSACTVLAEWGWRDPFCPRRWMALQFSVPCVTFFLPVRRKVSLLVLCCSWLDCGFARHLLVARALLVCMHPLRLGCSCCPLFACSCCPLLWLCHVCAGASAGVRDDALGWPQGSGRGLWSFRIAFAALWRRILLCQMYTVTLRDDRSRSPKAVV